VGVEESSRATGAKTGVRDLERRKRKGMEFTMGATICRLSKNVRPK